MEKRAKKKRLFSEKMHLLVCKYNILINKWKNGQKNNDFLARKCIYWYLNIFY